MSTILSRPSVVAYVVAHWHSKAGLKMERVSKPFPAISQVSAEMLQRAE